MTDIKELKKRWMKNPKFVEEYEALSEELATHPLAV